jgi:thiamine pyrophosphate-dependent acetolactate synthase large subunit-like protein
MAAADIRAAAEPKSMKIAADALIATLAHHGVGILFHLPGVETLPVTERMVGGSPVRPIMVAHEQAAAFGAFGYGRVSGRPGVCLTVPGPGATNLVTGIAAAKADGVPVVAITTSLLDHLIGTGAAHDCDLAALFVPIVKAQLRAGTPDEVGPALDHALALSLEAPRGPVQLLVTGAVLAGQLAEPSQETLPLQGGGLGGGENADLFDRLNGLAARLKSARRPILYTGRAVIDADAVGELRQLAEMLGAGVVTDESARGIVDERSAISLGTASHRGIARALEQGDMTVAIGARFSQWSTQDWSLPFPEPLIRIDGWDAPLSPTYHVETQIVGDIKLCLVHLLDRIEERKPGHRRAGSSPEFAGGDTPPPFHPAAVLNAIRKALPEDGIAVVDGSSTGTWAAEDIFPVYQPHGFVTPEVLKELGSATMVGIGAALAAPERPVVAIQGDGGLLFQLGELSTVVRERIPLAIVVFNDGHYNADRLLLEHMFAGDPKGCALHNPDFIALASAFGLAAVRAGTLAALETALAEAIASRRPTLIDVPIDPAPVPHRLRLVFDALKKN